LPLEQHPDYLRAVEERNKASLDLTHVEVFAPRAGVLAHFEMQAGELVAGSVPLFSLVDDSRVWIEANYKETDLTWMRLGQIAEIKIDAYPDLKWQGKVLSITPGTGSEFSLLPAQNSSGNWVKVVQRISVKLEMETLQNAPLLTAGMSAQVIVDTKHQRKAPWQN
jgi:membrane fusion protein (multidrug efflux system)